MCVFFCGDSVVWKAREEAQDPKNDPAGELAVPQGFNRCNSDNCKGGEVGGQWFARGCIRAQAAGLVPSGQIRKVDLHVRGTRGKPHTLKTSRVKLERPWEGCGKPRHAQPFYRFKPRQLLYPRTKTTSSLPAPQARPQRHTMCIPNPPAYMQHALRMPPSVI